MFLGITDYHAPVKKAKEEESKRYLFSLDYSGAKKANVPKRQTQKIASSFPTDVNWTSYKHLKNKG